MLPCSLPLKCKEDMAEKQDIAMNQFQIISDAPYVYVELADGSQGKIKKSDLADVLFNQKGLYPQNIRKTKVLAPGEIFDFGVKGGLVVLSTTSIQEQCVALFSCYGEENAIQLISSNERFIIGNRNSNNSSKLVLFREDSADSCFIKNNWNGNISIYYQIVAGFW